MAKLLIKNLEEKNINFKTQDILQLAKNCNDQELLALLTEHQEDTSSPGLTPPPERNSTNQCS